jgi:hypothetical protein
LVKAVLDFKYKIVDGNDIQAKTIAAEEGIIEGIGNVRRFCISIAQITICFQEDAEWDLIMGFAREWIAKYKRE